MRKARWLVVGVVVALALSACGAGSGEPSAVVRSTEPAADGGGGSTAPGDGSGGQMEPADPQVDEPITPMDDVTVMGSAGGPNSADDVMLAAGLAVQEFWSRTYPDVYGDEFEELSGGFWTYGPDTPPEDLPPCPGVTSYDDIAVNAFYCPDADLIAWDREGLVAPFIDEFGEFGAAIIMAHEFGHAVQGRTGDFDTLPGVITELQADCFAGSWIADVVDGGSADFEADIDELDLAVAGQIEIRDAPGSDPNDPSAHGSGFDRVSSLSDGVFDGASSCADYATTPPEVTQVPFTADDAATGGDLGAEELLGLLVPDLDAFYAGLFTEAGEEWDPVDELVLFDPGTDDVSCGDTSLTPDEAEFAIFYCAPEDTVEADATMLLPALEEIGDFALGSEVARQWAFSAQVQQGITENTRETSLHADCMTGLYAGDLYFQEDPRERQLSLSAGDLDEAIISFLAFSGREEDAASPFERSDAFRTGFAGTVDDCQAILEGG